MYIATSAARMTLSTVLPCSGKTAMPIEPSHWSARPPTTTGSSRTFSTRRTTGTTDWRSGTSGSRNADSTPPRRAAVSVGREPPCGLGARPLGATGDPRQHRGPEHQQSDAEHDEHRAGLLLDRRGEVAVREPQLH